MTQNLQAEIDLEISVSLSVALEAIKAAIQDAWADTRAQMADYQFHPAVVHTAFGQFLVHNVRNKVFRIDTPGMVTELVLNRRRTAYHLKVVLKNELFLTISAVEDPVSPPRPAQFRTDYVGGSQSWFRITAQNDFEPVPPVKSTAEYIQILHGPLGTRGQKRQELGFIHVAFPHDGGGYRRLTIPLDAYMAELSMGSPVGTEVVIEEGDLGVILKEESLYADE